MVITVRVDSGRLISDDQILFITEDESNLYK